jgi:Bardet-Biedl syndrome 4 protein
VYDEAQRIGIEDWEIWHNKGLCQMYLKQYEPAAECFRRANSIQRHDATFMQLGKVPRAASLCAPELHMF